MSEETVIEGRLLAEKYEVTRLLGKGGMGAVYEARNHLGKRFAVKLLLKPELANDGQLLQRFFREAKASAAIESEHIVEVYDTGVDPATKFPFIIMELLKGEDLEHTIARVGALNAVAAARVISQAAEGLASAHAAGIVHRDIKPANIFMTMRTPTELVVKILDFGIAKQAVENLTKSDGNLTRTGSMLGTPLYMSPEQARGLRTVDSRTDVWSLGMCLYEALAGHTPFGNVETVGELILSICASDVRPLREIAPWVPQELANVVHRALTRDAAQRLPTAREFIAQLAPFTEGTSAITPSILTGVADAERTAAPAAATIQHSRVPSSSVSAVTAGLDGRASSGIRTGETTPSPTPKSKPPALAIIAVAAVVVLGVAGFAVSKAFGGKKSEEPASTESTAEPTTSANEATTTDPPKKTVDSATATPPPQPTIAPSTTASELATVAPSATPSTIAVTDKKPKDKETIKSSIKTTTKATTAPTPSITAAPTTTSSGRKITETLDGK